MPEAPLLPPLVAQPVENDDADLHWLVNSLTTPNGDFYIPDEASVVANTTSVPLGMNQGNSMKMEMELQTQEIMPESEVVHHGSSLIPVNEGNEENDRCWGAELHYEGPHRCTPGFRPGRGHFKNKFCPNCCIEGVLVSAERLIGLTAELKATLQNEHTLGFWKRPRNGVSGELSVHLRVINNTHDCSGPPLVVYRGTPPDGLVPAMLPDGWEQHGLVRLAVARGTLVPQASLRGSKP